MKQKNLSSDQKRIKVKPELFNARLIITCLFSLIALTLYLGGFFNAPALILIVAGALWNFFTDINSFFAFLLSLLVCVIYSLFAIKEGLYMNAILYALFYVPLQFVVWISNINNKDMSISKDKRLFKKGFNYELVALVFVTIGLSVLCVVNSELTITIFDSVSACILGFSAMLQSYRFREYYIVRPIAVLIAILLYVAVILINGFGIIPCVMILLYAMYFVNDLLTSSFWKVTVDKLEPEEVEKITEKGNKELEQARLKEYQKYIEQENKNKDGKGGNVTA